jgi:NTE family protein
LFEAPYTRALMDLGQADALARRDEVLSFFGWTQHASQPLDIELTTVM